MDPPPKIEGEATRNNNTVTIWDEAAGKSYSINLTKIGNKQFVDDVNYKAANHKKGQQIVAEFKVRFYLINKQIDPRSLEFVPPSTESFDVILKSVAEMRLTPVFFSTTTDLMKASEGCGGVAPSAPSPATPTVEIPPGAKPITIADILHRANEGITARIEEINKLKGEVFCVACKKSEHSAAAPISFNTWYYLNESDESGGISIRAKHRLKELQAVLTARPYCECDLKAIPRSPNNVFRRISAAEKERIDAAYEGTYATKSRVAFDQQSTDLSKMSETEFSEAKVKGSKYGFYFPVHHSVSDKQRVNHIVPRSAGGCPTQRLNIAAEFKENKINTSNLIPIWNMCTLCQLLDELFTKWQKEQQHSTIDAFTRNVINKKSK